MKPIKIKFKPRTWREVAGLCQKLRYSAEKFGFFPKDIAKGRKYFYVVVTSEWVDYTCSQRIQKFKYIFFIKPNITVKCKGCGEEFKCGEDEKRDYCDIECERRAVNMRSPKQNNGRGVVGDCG